MKTIMWDLENADTWFNQISIIDSAHKNRKMNIQLYEQVFVSHKITKQQFYDSYQYYQTRPDQMKILIDSVVAYGERVRTSYKGARKY
jgi:predicted SnoaL-like aldol condensation-catalyzing enzyme